MNTAYSFYFAQPWWLLGCLLIVPVIWLSYRSLAALGPVRRVLAVATRCVVVIILVVVLARPVRYHTNEQLTVIAVLDRSQSIPQQLQDAALDYLRIAASSKKPTDRLAVVDVAETASIARLPSGKVDIPRRNFTLKGYQSRLADGIQMAMAIAPPDSGTRIVLISEGNQTAGDLKEAARLAAANKIPIDVLPIYYNYDREVIFKRLVAPAKARTGQTVSLRFILSSTTRARGRLVLNLNDKPVDLSPGSAEIAAEVDLKPGTNVKMVSIPITTPGVHEFKALFIPDDPNVDTITLNNRSSAVTYVSGPGHVLVVDADGTSGQVLAKSLKNADIETSYIQSYDFPEELVNLMGADAVILVNTDISNFTYQQQQMLVHYVKELGGGLVMIGGPSSFGAGGWIGSPVAEVLPVDLDPPQKKQLPKGALVLIMHACEMPQGNYWGKKVALAAVRTLSRLDLVGILAYNWQGTGDWVFPLSEVGDKKAVSDAIKNMVMGDMPSLHDHIQQAYNELVKCNAGQKHVIVITDADPQPPSPQLLNKCRQAGITVTGVCIFPHNPTDKNKLLQVARYTGGRFYDVTNPQRLPQIFIKEAQVVKRSLIVEQSFSPVVTFSLSEIIKGLDFPLPNLDGYVLTGPKGGLCQVVLASDQADPILATCQAGLGRCVAFTSSIDSRWAANWLQWPGFERFWEQTIRWVGKPAQSSECEVFADVQGQSVTVNVEAIDAEGKFLQLADIEGRVMGPEVSSLPLELTQVGPGQYQGRFEAWQAGSYVIYLRYRKLGQDGGTGTTQATVTVPFAPEFHDLHDNAALLKEVSEISGGRILSADPNQARLFDYSGVTFPETRLPLTKRLLDIWLALFLLDVAIRRIAVDLRAAFKRAVSIVSSLRPRSEATETIDKLKQRQAKLREQLAARSAEPAATARYNGAEKYTGELPVAEAEPKTGKPLSEKPAEPTKPKAKEPEPQRSHIDQLLRAKRRAIDRDKIQGPEDKK